MAVTAPNSTQIVITGDKEIDRKLARLGGRAAKRISRSALSFAMTPVSQAIRRGLRSAFQKRSGRLHKSVGKRVRTNKRGDLEAVVGVNVGRKGSRRAWYGPALLAATGAARYANKKRGSGKRPTPVGDAVRTIGPYRGALRQRGVVPRAMAVSRSESLGRMKQRALQQIEKEVRKA